MSRHTAVPGRARRLVRWGLAAALSLIPALLPAQSAPMAVPVAAGTSDALRPGDVIRVRIWKEPDLSGEFPVDEVGIVILPKVGPMQVSTEPPGALKEKLIRAYSGSLNHTSIEITFLRRIQVLGAVRNPGIYPLDPTLTISDAIALAGGITNQGHPDRVELVRFGRKLPGRLSVRSRIGDSELRSGDQIYVPERSWMSRNPGIVAGVVTTVASLLVALTR